MAAGPGGEAPKAGRWSCCERKAHIWAVGRLQESVFQVFPEKFQATLLKGTGGQ